MNQLYLPNYNLPMTLLGGQSFCWDFEDGWFYGFTRDKAIKLRKEGTNLYWQTYPENDDLDFLKNYLRFKVDYPTILKKIKKDKYIKLAIKKYPDLRLLKQDFEETLLSFLISPNNNIQAIRKIIRFMCQKFGRKLNLNNKKIFLFPKTEILANARIEDLLECKLGFRAKYLKGAANVLLGTNLSKNIYNFSESRARNSLKEIRGVGDKIADCVLVFALGFDNVTPLDVWAKRVLTNFYKVNPKMRYEEMRKWTNNYFNGYAAWAGQFLYEYIRHMKV